MHGMEILMAMHVCGRAGECNGVVDRDLFSPVREVSLLHCFLYIYRVCLHLHLLNVDFYYFGFCSL